MRKALIQALYAWLLEGDAPEEMLAETLEFHAVEPANRARAREIFAGIVTGKGRFDEVLSKFLEHWSLDRLGQVERAVCYLALHEIETCEDVPLEVIIDEAVRLAKEYAGDEPAHFVNGLVDAAARTMRPSTPDLRGVM